MVLPPSEVGLAEDIDTLGLTVGAGVCVSGLSEIADSVVTSPAEVEFTEDVDTGGSTVGAGVSFVEFVKLID